MKSDDDDRHGSLERGLAWLRARFESWRAHNHGRHLEMLPYEDLRHIHLRRFPDTDRARFARLWCELSALCDVRPLELHEDNRLLDLNPRVQGRWFGSEAHPRLENIEELVTVESAERPYPKAPLETVGDVLDYLLIAESGAAIQDATTPPSSHASTVYRR